MSLRCGRRMGRWRTVLATAMLTRRVKAAPTRAKGPAGRRDAQSRNRKHERRDCRQTYAGQPAQAARRILPCAHRHISSNQELKTAVPETTACKNAACYRG